MILVDTGIWIDHFRSRDQALVELAANGRIALHPFVLGELSLGHLRDRESVLALLRSFPALQDPGHDAVIAFGKEHRLAGSGIGWVDACLLASASVGGATVWTRDSRLHRAAERLSLATTV